MIDLTPGLVAKYRIQPGIVGEYHASRVWGIVNGYTTVEEYLNGKTVTPAEAIRMSNGAWKHQQVQELLGDNFEIEKEIIQTIEPYGWHFVGKVDFMDEIAIYEIKTTDAIMDKAKPWHITQAKLYCTLFEKPVGHIVQPIVRNGRLILKHLGSTKRNDKWFEEQMHKVHLFHEKLPILNG